MKHFANRIASTLGVGVLLALSASAQAQTPNIMTLTSDPANPALLKPGDVFKVTELVSPGADATGKSVKITSARGVLLYDPNIFDDGTVVGVMKSTNFSEFANDLLVDANSNPIEFDVNGKKYHGWRLIGNRAGSKPALGANSELGNVTLKVKHPTTLAGFYGATSLLYTTKDLFPTLPDSQISRITGSPSTVLTSFDVFRLSPQIVPGPSSLAIFAMGGMTPVLALLRRRRKA